MENTENVPSEGEFRVRTSFNVTGSGDIDALKKAGAAFIDLIGNLTPKEGLTDRQMQSFGRLKSIAMTDAESATSWAVKAATL